MERIFNELLFRPVKHFFRNSFEQISQINKKYATPSIKTGRAVKFSLLLLRLYLVLLLALLFYKFFTTVVK